MGSSKKKPKFTSKTSQQSTTTDGVDEMKHWSGPQLALVGFLALLISGIHRSHVTTMFENDRHFSHLSTLERELAFRTEMGLYFSYFKTMIHAESIPDGLGLIMRDNITEYPSTINTLKRFNLYPEVTLGIAYRFYRSFSDMIGHKTTKCWTVNRGEGLSPVQSCEGMGEPAYFYVEFVYLLNGLMMGAFFLFGTFLSDSIAGGLITVLCYFFNHGECTRVQWTPPLRESFGYPFCVVQMLLVTIVIKNQKSSLKDSLFIASAQICFMLSWQFAQFTLLTQTLATLGTFALGYISTRTFKTILLGQTIGLAASFLLLFGNEMLLTSLFACALMAAWALVFLDDVLSKLPHWTVKLVTQGVLFILVTLSTKFGIGKILQLEDDKHIGEIFASKFSNFQNFHTMLYTCAKEFDYIEFQTIIKLFQTLLIPSTIVCVIMVTFNILRDEYERYNSPKEINEDQSEASSSSTKPKAELVYHTFQLIAFTAMAILIMRLKLFWTPQMCIFSSLLASRQIFPYGTRQQHFAVLAVLIGVMGVAGSGNITHQRSMTGEFSNPAQEQLVEWIKANTPKDAVFAGAMPTMATVKLCTLRPIVNHPHYEDAGLRARTKKVYTMYSRKPPAEIKANLQDLGVHYAIMEHSWCSKRSRQGCGMAEIWDLEDVENRKQVAPTCHHLAKNPEPHFKRVFANSVYQVLKLT